MGQKGSAGGGNTKFHERRSATKDWIDQVEQDQTISAYLMLFLELKFRGNCFSFEHQGFGDENWFMLLCHT